VVNVATELPSPVDAPAPYAPTLVVSGNASLSNEKLAMWLFLGTECLLFGGLISTYLLYKDKAVTGPTPSELYDIPFTSISSFILLMSSLTMVLAVAAIQRGDHRRPAAEHLAQAAGRVVLAAAGPRGEPPRRADPAFARVEPQHHLAERHLVERAGGSGFERKTHARRLRADPRPSCVAALRTRCAIHRGT